MAAPAIKGTTVLIGFPTGETVAGVIRDTYDKETTADIEPVRDEDNCEVTMLVSNAGLRITVDGKCSSAVTLKKGDIVTINSVKYLCEAAVNRYTTTLTRFSGTFYKPAGATFT
jgi:hypothetical protein